MAKVGQAGFDCVLTIGASGEMDEAKDVSIAMTRGEIDDSARDTEGWRSFIPGLGEWTIDFMLIKKSPESTAAAAIRAAFIANTLLEDVKMEDKNGYGWQGDVAVVDFSENQPYEDVVAISVRFRGHGPPTQVTPSS